jgi:hypothetical protein
MLDKFCVYWQIQSFHNFPKINRYITYLDPTSDPTNEIYLQTKEKNGNPSSTLVTGIPTIT